MKLMLVGAGTEDPRSPAWGHVYASLLQLGHTVFRFDHLSADRLAVKMTGRDQQKRMLTNFAPDIVLSLPTDESSFRSLVEDVQFQGARLIPLAVPEINAWTAPGSISLHAACNVELFDVESTVPNPIQSYDSLIVGPMTPARALIAHELLTSGISVGFYGDGWDSVPEFRSSARSPVAYPFTAAALRSSRSVLVLPIEPEAKSAMYGRTGPIQASLDAAAAGVPVIVCSNAEVGDYLKQDEEFLHAGTASEVVACVQQAIQNPDVLTKAARMKIESSHLWVDRWKRLLDAPQPSIRINRDGPKVSYITAAYNIQEYIGPALESLLNQTERDIEILVMNDGSPDSSADIVRRYMSDPRIRLFEQQNVGQTGRFDFIWWPMLTEAKGEYICNLGGDDIAMPEKTAKQLSVFAEDPGADVVHTGGFIIDEATTAKGPAFQLEYSYDSTNMLRTLIRGNCVAMPTMMIRRSFFERIGLFTGGFSGDYECWIKAARVGRFRYLPDALVAYRVHDKSASTGPGEDNGRIQGLQVRLSERERCSIVDLYPAMEGCPESDVAAWVAAYVDLGNAHLRYLASPEWALREYESALELDAQSYPWIHFNRAIAYAYAGDNTSAQAAAQQAFAAVPELLGRPIAAHPTSLIPAFGISKRPFYVAPEHAKTARRWDGAPVSRHRVLVVPSWDRAQDVWAVANSFVQTFEAADDIDLVLPTMGLLADDALQRFGSNVPSGTRLEELAEITLESWDDLSFLPLDGFSGIVNLNNHRPIDAVLAEAEASWRDLVPLSRESGN